MTLNINRTDLSYPLPLFESRNLLPANRAVSCSVLFNGQEMGGLFITCSSKDTKYFNLVASTPPQPPLKFRMLNIEKQTYVIEIWMQFSKNPEKYLKVHLNPHDRQVRRLLKLGVETNMISFHFYDTESKLLSTAITGLDDEESPG